MNKKPVSVCVVQWHSDNKILSHSVNGEIHNAYN